MNNNNSDILNIVSILLGLQNLQENREQSAQNDVQSANDKQAKYILDEINKKFAVIEITLKEQTLAINRLYDLLDTLLNNESNKGE